ncbi:Xpr1 [Gossypium arboreum]|uniref:Xpr1 n=1 Tax=Gossypium arboreum TaxID=29729 RepID=A0A0B0NUN1_GOSAR|nr:Xpr1 [Gossypium arboreum]
MAQMQGSTVEQIAQLKTEAASREAEAQRKYDELQLQLKAKAAVRKQSGAFPTNATKEHDLYL